MRRILPLPVLLFAFVVVVACSGSSGGQRQEDADALVRFAQCMREHGQNVPDPDGDSYSITPPSGGPNAAWDAAMEACRGHLPDGGAPEPPDAAELEAQRQYATCMREHGIDMSDPDPNTGRSQIGGRLANATRDQLRADPGYEAAAEACKDKLPEGRE
jgi:hypothetical protein